VDAVVVGAGVAGLYAMYRLLQIGLDVAGVEAADGVGGTWFWNRYPGCRCDVPTIEYSYGFDPELEQEWSFPENMSAQPDIELYLNHVADRYDLRRHFLFGTRVTSLVYDEPSGRWSVETDGGQRYRATYCVMATGSLSAPNRPDIPGLESFAGAVVHTGLWPREGVALAGKRVGVIGTGSSGMQSIPLIAKEAAHVTVFQRTPHYAFRVPVAPVDPELRAYVRANYRQLRKKQRRTATGISGTTMPGADTPRAAVGAGALQSLSDPTVQQQVQELFAQSVRSRVHDPATAEMLIPTDYPIGCKRVIVETEYYETFNRDNVRLVDLRRGGIIEVTATSIRTEQGDHPLDVIVLATGFDALTGPLTRIDIRGRQGRSLQEKWAGGPSAYLGLVSAGFPNLFMITGPGSPSVLTNMVVACEQHGEMVLHIIEHMRAVEASVVDADPEAEAAWSAHVVEVAAGTQWTAPTCNSWYLGSNIAGKARAILPYVAGIDRYGDRWAEIVQDGFRGLVFGPTPAGASTGR
jgi:cation diffusion facilitator CzcD-associated flavoprotein CzcO